MYDFETDCFVVTVGMVYFDIHSSGHHRSVQQWICLIFMFPLPVKLDDGLQLLYTVACLCLPFVPPLSFLQCLSLPISPLSWDLDARPFFMVTESSLTYTFLLTTAAGINATLFLVSIIIVAQKRHQAHLTHPVVLLNCFIFLCCTTHFALEFYHFKTYLVYLDPYSFLSPSDQSRIDKEWSQWLFT